MARINLEDGFFDDPRLSDLSDILRKQGEKNARFVGIGLLTTVWKIGIGYWKRGQLIPHEVFERIPLAPTIIEAKFAEVREDGIYCFGADEYWSYFKKQSASGSKGGKNSAIARKEKYGHAGVVKPKEDENMKHNEASASISMKQTRSEMKRHEASSLLCSPLLSSSLLCSEKENTNTKRVLGGDLPNEASASNNLDTALNGNGNHDPSGHGTQGELIVETSTTTPAKRPKRPPKAKPDSMSSEVWAAYSEAFLARYKELPVRNPKNNRLLCLLISRIGKEIAPDVARYFLSHNNSYYSTRQHAVEVLLQDCEKLRIEMLTGKRTSTNQAKILEREQASGDALANYTMKKFNLSPEDVAKMKEVGK